MRKFEIEEKIKPLVDALNETGILATFSSCEGHFGLHEQELQDRNHADVRFDLLESISEPKLELFLTYLMTEFNNKHSFTPVELTAYKYYIPTMGFDELRIDASYMIKIEPFDRFESPEKKRKDVDMAILQASVIVKEWQMKNHLE